MAAQVDSLPIRLAPVRRGETTKRFLVGLFLLLHGLAHIAAGTAAQDAPRGIAAALPANARVVIATLLFLLVTPGFVAGGLGRWGVIGLRRIWAPATRLAVLASVFMFVLFGRSGAETVSALVLDALALFLADTPWRLTSPLQRAIGSAGRST